MSETIISVEQLSKSYRLGAIGGGTLRADVSRWLAKLRGKADPTLKIGQENHARLNGQHFHALRDVSFNVKQGEILGIIGRNGAGKSTLLKILSRVTAPTSGVVKIKGRMASLLEVGTGFHPELSGRENIFLNGAILGMTRAEIQKRFDEIVDFSGVEQFIDTPVKRYSSGMYVRLAFAVAAHLEPEILVVDEVLAVGDAQFQKKCLGKMQDVAGHGRTILFVSHNMGAVLTLCDNAVWLDSGQCFMMGTALAVGNAYLSANSAQAQRCFELDSLARHGSDGTNARIVSLEWMDGIPLRHGCPVRAKLKVNFSASTKDVRLGVGFSTVEGVRLVTYGSDGNLGESFDVERSSSRDFELCIEKLPLNPGNYTIDLGCKSGEEGSLDYLKGAGSVEVVPGPETPAHYFGKEPALRLNGIWKSI